MLQRVPLLGRLPRYPPYLPHFPATTTITHCRASSQLASQVLSPHGVLHQLPSNGDRPPQSSLSSLHALPTSLSASPPPSSTSAPTILSSDQVSLSDRGNFLVNSSFLNCCEPGTQLKVGVLLSGGVDSSVALRLLLAAGHSCTAFYLKIWFQEDFENFWSSCPWDEDLKFAQAVCDEVGVELQVVEFTEEYWKNVVSYMIAEYQAGRTPNPDVLCNSRIKFGAFLDHVRDMGFDRIASGHYAKVVHVRTGTHGTQAVLQLSKDNVKDQTYFLSHLSQLQLSQLIFPLGCVTKGEVRQIADELGLPNKLRKDSQGICFLGKVKFSDFICRHLGEREGRLLEAETGAYLGTHKGFWFYTIGQRHGLRLSHGPWYVVDKDHKNNVVFISREYFSGEKKRRAFEVHSFNWLGGRLPEDLSKLRCKVRHGTTFYNCHLTLYKGREDCTTSASALVELSEDDQGIAAGQYAAFYEEGVCLGSGVISEFKDSSSAVSDQAREAARLKELPPPVLSKSKLKKMSIVSREAARKTSLSDASESSSEGFLTGVQGWVRKCLSWIRSS